MQNSKRLLQDLEYSIEGKFIKIKLLTKQQKEDFYKYKNLYKIEFEKIGYILDETEDNFERFISSFL